MSIEVENARAAVAGRVVRWRTLINRMRIILWIIVALEYIVATRVEADEAVMLIVGAVCVAGAARWRPGLVLGEIAAASYLVLEEPGHYLPIVLVVLVAGSAAFTTNLWAPVLWAAGAASLVAGWNTDAFQPISVVRVSLLIALGVAGGRIVRRWMGDLISDISNGLDNVLNLRSADCAKLRDAVVDLASVSAEHFSALDGGHESVTRLRERVRDLEANRAAARAILGLDLASDVDLDTALAFDQHEARACGGESRPFMERPHFLSRRQSVDD